NSPLGYSPVASAVAGALCSLLAAIFGFLALRGIRRAGYGSLALFSLLVGLQMAGFIGFRATPDDAQILFWGRYLTVIGVLIVPAWLFLVRVTAGRPSKRLLWIFAGAGFLLLLTIPSELMLSPEIIEWHHLGVTRHPRPGPFHALHLAYASIGIPLGIAYWIIEAWRQGGVLPGGRGRVLPVILVGFFPVALSLGNFFNYFGLFPYSFAPELSGLGLVLMVATALLEEFAATHKHLEGEHARVLALNVEIEDARKREAELASENQRLLKEEIKSLKIQLGKTSSRLVGTSPAMRRLSSLIARVAPTEATVLVLGETGTGKELVARELHAGSPRAEKPFLAVNVAAMPEPLLESELFGHVEGAFTGARRARAGIFERAKGGTIFLDEIGEASPALQAKLLRVLQERVVTRLGGREDIPVDVRVAAATHRNLEQLQSEGRFREDLYFRLKVITLEVPPLRERGEDISLLAVHFLKAFTEKQKREIRGFSRDALELLRHHPWPGNVRELENAVEHAVAMADLDLIVPADLPPQVKGAEEGEGREPAAPSLLSDTPTMEELERRYIFHVIDLCHGNKAQAARRLGVDETTLYRKLKQYASKTA
ncbi:MAG: sigma 54-interacting transcriptional regulator, partial [Bdellovibrionota bacterium]